MDDGLKSLGSADAARLGLSALLDGEQEHHELGMVCQAWRDDAQLRAAWHAYNLIGDVLRSDDLARDPGHDAAFLTRLRSRMTDEPVILAPAQAPAWPMAPAAARSPKPAAGGPAFAVATKPVVRRSWGAPLAMAAGVVTVVGVAVMMRGVAPSPSGPSLATAEPSSALVAVARRDSGGASAPLEAAALVRNPDLDRYLDAHRQYGSAGVIGAPGGFRQVATSPAGR
jgi:sigma-E factor negative regulatory protein RseA